MESLMSRVEVLSKDGAGLQRGGDIKKMLLSMDKVASRAQTGQKLDWTETGLDRNWTETEQNAGSTFNSSIVEYDRRWRWVAERGWYQISGIRSRKKCE